MVEQKKIRLFEEAPVPRAVLTLAIPTILSCLVMVIYNLADTYFVGMLNDPVENAAVTLAAPVLLAFNAVNNLFGVGSSSMMGRALGKRDYDTVRRSSRLWLLLRTHQRNFVFRGLCGAAPAHFGPAGSRCGDHGGHQRLSEVDGDRGAVPPF